MRSRLGYSQKAISMSLSHFDEKSGIVTCDTEWGRWWQTVGEVCIEIELEPGTRAKDVKVKVSPTFIDCTVKGKSVIRGNLFRSVISDETVWTIENQKLLEIQLDKVDPNPDKPWASLLEGKYIPNDWVFNEMRKKLDLEKFQIEHPGFDFSDAELKKNYDTFEPSNEHHFGRKIN